MAAELHLPSFNWSLNPQKLARRPNAMSCARLTVHPPVSDTSDDSRLSTTLLINYAHSGSRDAIPLSSVGATVQDTQQETQTHRGRIGETKMEIYELAHYGLYAAYMALLYCFWIPNPDRVSAEFGNLRIEMYWIVH